MNREQELGQALNKFITQTEQALENGTIYSEEFRKQLNDARRAVTKEQADKEDTYVTRAPGFHVLYN